MQLAFRNFINSLDRIPQTIDQYKEKNAVLVRDIPLLKEIANKQWKKEDELKGLKSELASTGRKTQLELAKGTETTHNVVNNDKDIMSQGLSKKHFKVQF